MTIVCSAQQIIQARSTQANTFDEISKLWDTGSETTEIISDSAQICDLIVSPNDIFYHQDGKIGFQGVVDYFSKTLTQGDASNNLSDIDIRPSRVRIYNINWKYKNVILDTSASSALFECKLVLPK